MKRFLLSFSFLLLGLLSLQAQQKIILHMNDGSTVTRNVNDVDSITFGEEPPETVSINAATVVSKTNMLANLAVGIASGRSLLSIVGLYYSSDKVTLGTSLGKKVETSTIPESGDVNFTIDGLSQETVYYVLAYGVSNGETVYAADTLTFTTNGKYPVPEIVDLGLSVKWASFNVGAQVPGDYGSYIGWGDPTGDNSSYLNSDYPTLSSSSSIAGSSYDITAVKWGKGWKIPTREQWRELVSGCDWTWSSRNGIYGWEIKSKTNDNSIFLPNGGYYTPKEGTYVRDNERSSRTFYWTCEQYDQTNAYEANPRAGMIDILNAEKMIHLPIRAIYDTNSGGSQSGDVDDDGEQVPLNEAVAGSAVDLGLSCLWADKNVGATTLTDAGDYYAWGETETKSEYSVDNYTLYGDTISDISRSKHDVARMTWGGKWRMPTVAELYALIDGCTWTWDSSKGGYTVTSKSNGKSIFLPAGGYRNGSSLTNSGQGGSYWTSENDNRDSADNKKAYGLKFSSGETGYYATQAKKMGYLIRPVRDK